jgi:hypothetical protein
MERGHGAPTATWPSRPDHEGGQQHRQRTHRDSAADQRVRRRVVVEGAEVAEKETVGQAWAMKLMVSRPRQTRWSRRPPGPGAGWPPTPPAPDRRCTAPTPGRAARPRRKTRPRSAASRSRAGGPGRPDQARVGGERDRSAGAGECSKRARWLPDRAGGSRVGPARPWWSHNPLTGDVVGHGFRTLGGGRGRERRLSRKRTTLRRCFLYSCSLMPSMRFRLRRPSKQPHPTVSVAVCGVLSAELPTYTVYFPGLVTKPWVQ